MPAEVFVDFDGTITDLETLDVLVRHYAGEEALAQTARGLSEGRVALRDVLQRQASYIRGDFEEVADLLERQVTIDPTFAPFVARCRELDLPVTVVSSGIARLIERRLRKIGLGDVPIIANDVVVSPSGWRIRFRDAVPNGTDKAAVVRAARERGAATIYIGDGFSDYAAAVAADTRFARRGKSLEPYLRERRLPLRTFTSFADIAPALEVKADIGIDVAPLTRAR